MKTLNALVLASAAAVALPLLGGCAHHDRGNGYSRGMGNGDNSMNGGRMRGSNGDNRGMNNNGDNGGMQSGNPHGPDNSGGMNTNEGHTGGGGS